MNEITVKRAERVEPSDELTRLFSELKGHTDIPDTDRINSLIAKGSIAFYLMEKDGAPIGMASVISCRTAVCDKLWIEDVCISSGFRGQGLGRKLMEFVLKDAADFFGKGTFWLTSRPSREAARSLYKSLGFAEYETGVFKMREF